MGLILIIILVAIVIVALSHGRGTTILGGSPGGYQHCCTHDTRYEGTSHGTTTETPFDILSGCYARGEIDRTEYLEKKRAFEV